MRSYGLVRTNVGLTTNVKLVVGSNYGLYLDTIVSSPELSLNRYKKFQFDKDTYWEDVVSTFFQGTPVDIAYKIKYDNDNDKMSTDFANQYDDLYEYGARNITDNKFYSEEYEYFAPLYINKGSIPSNFLIFRVDGPGLISLNKDTFRTEIIQNLKFVKNFDLGLGSYLGQWLNNSILKNKFYPNNSLYIDFRRFEFSSWRGIDYERGGYTEKTLLLDSNFEYEQPYSEMEKLISDGYKNNKIIFPNIINFSYLFDDTPATPETTRKWSLNRYLGFYIDELTLTQAFSPNKLPKLRDDVFIDENNNLISDSGQSPFLNDWETNDYPYLELGGKYYRIEKYQQITSSVITKIKNTRNTFEEKKSNTSIVKYRVISETKLTNKTSNDINKNLIFIDSDKFLNFQNGLTFSIDDYESSDVWLIQIGDLFHNIIKDGDRFRLNTDWGIKQSDQTFRYYINGENSQFAKSLDLVTSKDFGPTEFGIYKCKFTDIKDFDTSIIDTTHSRFEYELPQELTDSDEPKMYVQDLESSNNPKDYIQFKLQNKVVNIPTSSEYTANSETFRLIDGELNGLWRKNSERLKWGFVGSISSNDYPYLLNNTILSEDFNKSPNPIDTRLSREKRNLDTFYSINSDNNNYSFHSLHIEDYQGSEINKNFKFEIDKYLGLSYSLDYFSYFFGKKIYFNRGLFNSKGTKFSYFQSGDNSTPNVTLFKGLKFKLSEVDNINITENKIDRVNLKNSNKFENWKFSILLSSNDFTLTSSPSDINVCELVKVKNPLMWRMIDNWKTEKEYKNNSLVIFDEILYRSLTYSRITDPSINPKVSVDWEPYDKATIFYSPYFDGIPERNNLQELNFKVPPLVYNYGEYYYSSPNSYDFWNIGIVYQKDDIVTYRGKNWISLIDDNIVRPSESSEWTETDLPTRWSKVGIWRSEFDYKNSSWSSVYGFGNYVVWNEIVWAATQSTKFGIPPDLGDNWKRIYSLKQDTSFFYGPSIKENNIIFMNEGYYECVSNQYNEILPQDTILNYSLDNGIYVIVNEKYKNVLINIYINDNTYSEVVETSPTIWEILKNRTSNTNRDDIYTTIFTKLSTNNIMNSLNDVSNNFGFSDKIKYIIIGESSNRIYDFNNLVSLTNLPYFLTCDPPDELLIRSRSNIYEPVSLKPSEIKSRRILKDNNIDNLSKLNYYNEMHLASKITTNFKTQVILPNYSGLKNENYLRIYRFSGFYSPILRDVEIFDSPTITKSQTNYKFDTSLTNFGIIKQRLISKVNRKSNLLRLRNQPNLKSVYPMIDEYGYHIVDFFIFKSTWDFEYHFETLEYEPEIQLTQLETKNFDAKQVDFRNNNTNLL